MKLYAYIYIYAYKTKTYNMQLDVVSMLSQTEIPMPLLLSSGGSLGLLNPEKRKLRGASHQCI